MPALANLRLLLKRESQVMPILKDRCCTLPQQGVSRVEPEWKSLSDQFLSKRSKLNAWLTRVVRVHAEAEHIGSPFTSSRLGVLQSSQQAAKHFHPVESIV